MNKALLYEACIDDDIGPMLAGLFAEGHPEVEIQHPTQGTKIITHAEFEAMQTELARAKDMSPADKMVERKRLANQCQIRLRTDLIAAEVRIVDIDDDTSFGIDVNNNPIDMDARTFMLVRDYPSGVGIQKHEIGALIDGSGNRKPIRLVASAD